MALWLVTLIKKLEVEGFIPMWRKKKYGDSRTLLRDVWCLYLVKVGNVSALKSVTILFP